VIRYFLIVASFAGALTAESSASEISAETIDFFSNKAAEIKGEAPSAEISSELPPPKCGTSTMLAIFNLVHGQGERSLASVLERPDLPFSYWSDHFVLHYALTGPDSVYKPWEDVNPSDGVPDYINHVADIFEYVWQVEVDTMGYLAPLPDAGRGGDDRYDIYLRNLGIGYFGFTTPESVVQGYRAFSYSEVENDFRESSRYRLNPLEAVRVTAAHEFFHAVQFAYDVSEYQGYDDIDPYNDKLWWFEASSTWIEDVVYDDINDYRGYLAYFYRYPWMALGTFSFLDYDRRIHAYASCVWPIFLTEKFSDLNVMRQIWEECGAPPGGYNTLDATNTILQQDQYGSSLDAAFLEFEIWNFHTGALADTASFFSEGLSFPAVDTTVYISGLDSIASFDFSEPLFPPEDLAANYIVIRSSPTVGGVGVDFNGLDIIGSQGWYLLALGYRPQASLWTGLLIDPFTGDGSGEWRNWDRYSAVVIIPVVSGLGASDTTVHQYSGSAAFSSALFADFDIAKVDFISPLGGGRKGDPITPVVRYNNNGRQTVSFPVHLTIAHGGIVYSEISNVTDLAPSANVDVAFPLFAPGDIGTYILTAISELFNDQLPFNDTLVMLYSSVGAVGPLLSAYPSPLILEFDTDALTIPYSFDPGFQYQGTKMRIYDASGQLVKELSAQRVYSGSQSFYGFRWDGRNDGNKYVASGVYIYLLESRENAFKGKIAVINKRR